MNFVITKHAAKRIKERNLPMLNGLNLIPIGRKTRAKIRLHCIKNGCDTNKYVYFQYNNGNKQVIYVCVQADVAEYILITAFELGDEIKINKGFMDKIEQIIDFLKSKGAEEYARKDGVVNYSITLKHQYSHNSIDFIFSERMNSVAVYLCIDIEKGYYSRSASVFISTVGIIDLQLLETLLDCWIVNFSLLYQTAMIR